MNPFEFVLALMIVMFAFRIISHKMGMRTGLDRRWANQQLEAGDPRETSRLRDEVGELQLVPPEERVSGPGATPVMAAFTHLNPEGSRFSDGTYGVYYAAHSLETAIAEVSHHRGVFLRRTDEAAIDVDMRLITASVEAELHDLLDAEGEAANTDRYASLLDPDDYGPSQALGRRLRAARSWGIRYPSVRHAGGECVGIFRPRALRHAKAAAHLALHWDGTRITHWYEKRQPHAVNE